MARGVLKYPIGYRYLNYEIIGVVRHKYNGKVCSKYAVKCLKCGEIIERNSSDIGKDLKCRGCIRNMEYYKYNVGDIVNGLKILEKRRQIRSNGSTQRAYLCKCIIDGYVSVHAEDNLIKGKGCPVCSDVIIVKGINDINTVAPWLGDLLENKEDGDHIGVGSHKKLRFRCQDCGTLTEPIMVYNVYYNKHISCRRCGDNISMPEKMMYGLLNQLGVDFEYQKSFEWSNRKIYDFYIKEPNMIIETHGLQHYRDDLNGSWGTSDEIKSNDEFKRNNAKNNGILHYVEIDCSKPNPLNLVKVYKDAMSKYFDLSNVDFDKLVLESAQSFCVKSGDLWNGGDHDISSISQKLRLTPQTIKRYLTTMSKIGYLNTNYPV